MARADRLVYHLRNVLRKLRYIDGQQRGDTPDIERAAMDGSREVERALEEIQPGLGRRLSSEAFEESMRRVARRADVKARRLWGERDRSRRSRQRSY